VDLLYIRDPLQGNLMDLVNAKHKIFRIADNDAGFSSHNKLYSEVEKQVAQKVDLVAYTAKELEDIVNNLNPKQSYYLPNGVDFELFQGNKEPPQLYQALRRPIIVYAGSIDFWFDYDLINRLAADFPQYSFVIIGPNQKYGSKFVDVENLILTGAVPHSELPTYLAHADVGIIPFNREEYPKLVNSISPVKLFEYMASGLPVLSTKWDELENIDSPAVLCETHKDFLSALKDIPSLKRTSDSARRFAKNNDWSNRYNDLVNLISND
jgi:glycosyltransferase involved in cell wall biosynthesis